MLRLEKIGISGFKGISERIEIEAKDFNVIVGKNDSGKSTILKALDLFINNKQYTRDFLNVNTDTFTVIEVFLSTNNTTISIDDSINTTFENENLLNEEGYIHLIKKWDNSKNGKISPDLYIKRKFYQEIDFFSLTESKFIKLCMDNGLESEDGLMTNIITGIENNIAEKRKNLNDIYNEQGFTFEYIEEKLPLSGQSRLKKLETAIKKVLPKFEYYLADSPLSESDSTIQKYFKDLAFSFIQDDINTDDIESSITTKLQEVLQEITSKINSVVPENEQVSAQIDFDWSKLITTTFRSDDTKSSIPLSARGDGFRRITMMSYFEYLAEQNKHRNQNIIFGFEEPETFLHPTAQENLFEKLYDISKANYQVFLTTHSPFIVSKTKKEHLHHIFKNNGKYNYIGEVTDHVRIAEDLGVSVDNQFISTFEKAKALLILEGIDDCNAFNHICDQYHKNGDIAETFETLGIVTLPIGGCDSVKHWVSLDLLNTLNKPYFIYLDSDKESLTMDSPNKEKLLKNGFIEGTDFLVSRKRELENYITPNAISRLVPGAILSYTDWCDVKKISKTHAKQIQLGGKKIVNKLFRMLNINELKETFNPSNSDDEFIQVYNCIKSKLN